MFNKKTKLIETFHTNWHVIKTLNKIIFSISWSLVDYEVGKDERNNIVLLKIFLLYHLKKKLTN